MEWFIVAAIAGALLSYMYMGVRVRRGRARPIFERSGIDSLRLTEGLVHALVSDRGRLRADTRVLNVSGAGVAIEREGAAGRIILLPLSGLDPSLDLVRAHTVIDRQEPDGRATVVLVGGEFPPFEAALRRRDARVLHVGKDGAVTAARPGLRSSAAALVVENALSRLASDLEDGAFPALDLAAVQTHAEPPEERSVEYRLPPAPASVALTLAIGAVFGAQVWFSTDSVRGDGTALAVAWRMGALHRPAVLEGEWQRLIAAPFLHFGAAHLLMNGWAQWALARQLELIFGSRLLLALWFVSAVSGSLASVAFNSGTVSAGASGAVFGLLGAFAAFVFLRKGADERPVPRSVRSGVISTLLLNLLISFIPGIDLAAHAGGLVAGALAGAVIVRRRDVPESRRANPWLIAAVVIVALGAGVGWMSVRHRPDLVETPPEISSTREVAGVHLPEPRGLELHESREGEVRTLDWTSPANPFSVVYRLSLEQQDEGSAVEVAERFRSPKVGVDEAERSTWIAVSWVGVVDRRAIEIVVAAPTSLRKAAKALCETLARSTAGASPQA